MEYKVTKNGETDKEIEIKVPLVELNKIIDEETNKLQKEVKIDGYRKGRVPRLLVQSRYKDSLKVQAMDRLIKNSYAAVLDEKKWKPASQAELLKVEEGDPIMLQMHIQVIPEFEVKDYVNVEVFKESPMPDEFLLEQGLNALKEQHAEIREVDRAAVVDDYVTLDIEVQEGEKTNKETDQTVRIGDRSLPDEVNRTLVGIKKLQTKEVEAQDKKYRLSVKKIEEKSLPGIDDDFAKKLNLKSVEELKTKLLENLKHQEEKRIEDGLKEAISKVVLERTVFNVPEPLVRHDYEKILKEYDLPDSESNKERFWDVAEKRIRFNLILDRIAEKEDLQVGESEIMDFVTKTGMTLSDQNRNEVIEYLRDVLSREKVMDFLYKNAKISEKSRIISPKEAKNDTRTVRH
ncbi:MAG: trigger factor [candidate division WOR-3 bacterium]